MPIYEFRCRECSSTEELLQKVNDPIPSVCASCGKENSLEKVVSQTSFQLKGGGWYSDLYASTPKTATTTPGKSDSPSTDSSKAETAPSSSTPVST